MGGEGGVSNGKVSGFHAAEFAFSRLAATFISVCRGGIYCARRRVSEANRRAAAALRPEIPPAGVCGGAGFPGRYGIGPYMGLQSCKVCISPVTAAFIPVRRGGIYPSRRHLRRCGVRRDEGIPPYGRSVCTASTGNAARFRGEKPMQGRIPLRPQARFGGQPPRSGGS